MRVGSVTNSELVHAMRTHVEKVVTGHAGLSRHASGNDDDLCAIEGLFEAGVVGRVALCRTRGVDMAVQAL